MTLSRAATDVIAERQRHTTVEGWTAEHDDGHTNGQIALAAAAYCESAARPTLFAKKFGAAFAIPMSWPWSKDWWKPRGSRPDLVRAGALILAEIERLDRAGEAT